MKTNRKRIEALRREIRTVARFCHDGGIDKVEDHLYWSYSPPSLHNRVNEIDEKLNLILNKMGLEVVKEPSKTVLKKK